MCQEANETGRMEKQFGWMNMEGRCIETMQANNIRDPLTPRFILFIQGANFFVWGFVAVKKVEGRQARGG